MKRSVPFLLLLALAAALLGSGAAPAEAPESGLTAWNPPSLGYGRLSLVYGMPDNAAVSVRPDCFQPSELRDFPADLTEECRFLKVAMGEERTYIALPARGGPVLIGTEIDDAIVWTGGANKGPARIAMLGDSVLAGQVGGMPPYTITRNPIPDTVERELGVPVDNLAIGGMGWASTQYWPVTIEQQIRKMDLSGYTMAVFQFGHNDGDAPLGSYTDTDQATVMGAVYRVCEYVHSQYPELQIVISTPTLCKGQTGEFPTWDFTVPHEAGWCARDLRDEMRLFCDLYHIPLIEGDKCFNAWNLESLMGDHVHPNEEGYMVAGHYFAGQIGALL